MRLFLDANILFSATITDGAIRRLLKDLTAAGHRCVVDTYVVEEAHRNILVHRPEARDDLRRIVESCERNEASFRIELDVDLAEKDRPVLSAAIGYRCEYLITGDSTHFGFLFSRTVLGTTVVSPRIAAERLLE